MTTRKNTKLRKLKRNNKSKKTKRNNNSKRNMKMKGGAKQISGFVKMLVYLNGFNDQKTTDKSSPNILEFVDWHGDEKSILARFTKENTNISKYNNDTVKEYINKNKTVNYKDFDNFKKYVIDTLINIENSIADAVHNPDSSEFKNLSMKTKGYEGVYPYYLLAKTSIDDDLIPA
jgi:hypothetical protein